ncbi:hypothetical protein pEaSNUABM28_00086 [Erwinia phage pEa_SNUABM_28]|uniref:Uncharacterized protein n=1 Tax=Erwinia phage pEa_SNUABM_16 TaxID=2869544 RepID=A0AAE9BUX7_9CAUD|nr:hypothetical protein MPK64_gp084 [Erwinia phage pEa_SNUABM_16]QZE58643.1 hypothetical protein pEaSNUABM28_00086 [Erwinia phage pEa_SNUABM_28]QZE58987.1 hypothetical protein pEaSNUABM18_00084 [Erwinia phage pEa_SNUABM_18]UAW96228.1 hypothetical protein pEaSNUABM16_00084 [Erwinia phage pEa_SNUABM_16]
MELFPYQVLSQSSAICLGLLHDTDAPANGEKTLHSAINDAIAMRLFVRTLQGTAPGRWQYTPYAISTLDTSHFLPAWIEYTGATYGYGPAFSTKTRIVPKIKLPSVDPRFASTVNTYLEAVAACLLAHRIYNTSDIFLSGIANNLSPAYSLTAENWYLCAEYDFGAEIELGALAGYSMGSTVSSLMLLGTNQTYLQAEVNGAWVDVIHTYDNLRTVTNNQVVTYELPTKVKAQKFRIVNKATSWPWSTLGHYPFGLQFYATYTGQKPRTLGKFKHMTVLQLQAGAAYSQSTTWAFNAPVVPTLVQSRYCSMLHVTVTDDIKQAANYDIVMQDASYNTAFGVINVPSFRTKLSPAVGRGV